MELLQANLLFLPANLLAGRKYMIHKDLARYYNHVGQSIGRLDGITIM
jgi:hypothetical protein